MPLYDCFLSSTQPHASGEQHSTFKRYYKTVGEGLVHFGPDLRPLPPEDLDEDLLPCCSLGSPKASQDKQRVFQEKALACCSSALR